MRYSSGILKLALFATGLSGIVAEYVLSTMATYFLGDSVFQWTMIVSIMLFSMGLGSRISKFIKKDLLLNFITIEYLLSLLTAFSSVIAYTVYAQFEGNAVIIYSMSIIIGTMIGMEIPLVVRLNEEFEELRVNVSSVMEKDYYGSLVGGMFFAFVGLPYLGLTYTPFVLGTVNFLVALSLFAVLLRSIEGSDRFKLVGMTALVGILLLAGSIYAPDIIRYGEQSRYRDRIVLEKQSKYQRIVITTRKDDFWLFINGNQQLSSVDEVMYHEPLVHPALGLVGEPRKVLIIGGGDGGAAREVLKYSSVEEILLVDLDPVMTELAQKNEYLLNMNQGSLNDPRVRIVHADGFNFLEKDSLYYDAILVDLPDPKSVELGRLYSREFYTMCANRLTRQGTLVTQAGSPYYASKAYRCIRATMEAAGFGTVALHNQVTTMGEWGWILGMKSVDNAVLTRQVRSLQPQVSTEWINGEAMTLITSFGKRFFPGESDSIRINTIHDPVLYRYYLDGIWDIY